MRRAGALLVAVAMVAAGFLVRDRVTGDDAGGASTTTLLCPTELAETCRVAVGDAATEAAGVTADRLVEAADPDVLGAQAWVVPAPWARLVVAERERLGRPPIFRVGDPIASSPVVLVAWSDEAAALEAACGGPVDWRCVADRASSGSGRPGAPDIDAATGLPVAAAQAVALLGTSDFARNDFDPGFMTLAAVLAAGQASDPLRAMRTRGPGEFTAVGAIGADARNLSSTFGPLEAYATAARADLVTLEPAGNGLDGEHRDALADAFTSAGWDPPADGPDGLPQAGSVLAAVRTLWKENR